MNMNNFVPEIVFRFADMQTAENARDMFAELGYDPSLIASQEDQPKVAIRVIDEDLTSALEIGQAYGGRLLEEAGGSSEIRTFANAYDLGQTPDPAEDQQLVGSVDSDDRDEVDVSAETYDHFSGDVHA